MRLRRIIPCAILLILMGGFSRLGFSASAIPSLNISVGGAENPVGMASAMKIFIFLTLVSIGPALLLTMTSFTRIIIVLSFLRQAIGVQQSPPNQIIIGLALFLTVFSMSPIFREIYGGAVAPFLKEEITQEVAIEKATSPLKSFMFNQTRKADLELFLSISHSQAPKNLEELSLSVLVPSFIISELKTAFQMGFLIYLPFVLIDLVVSMVLLVMGMMVLPPIVISLPFKLMLFVLVDGWTLVVGSLMRSFK